MAKRRIFKSQVLKVKTMGLTVYCETEFGQFRKECEAIDEYDYRDYWKWAKDGTKWGHRIIGKGDDNGVQFVAMLPQFNDSQSIVSFCAGLAFSTVCTVNNNNVSVGMVSRLAGVIWANLETEDIDIEDKPKEEETV